jgi:ABC-2 type transport system ATP-binding protein
MSRITIERLCKTFGRVPAVQDLTFTAEPGTITGFLGPNGAGKTTTLRMLLGLIRADAGRALIGGRRYVDLERPVEEVGAVLEATSFHPDRTARNHLRAVCRATGLPQRRVEESLELVELTSVADRAVGRFSLGMRQRLALATAIVGDPKVLIVDEPTSGLDPAGARWLRELLRQFADTGRTVLVSSHALFEMERTVDHVVIIAAGRLLRDAPLAELTGERESGLEQIFLGLTGGGP